MIVRAFFSALLFSLAAAGFAQKDNFILIQSETDQPFYARINNKTYSSSEIGHLIIPQLKDTLYDITIGFPKNIYPEQKFRIALHEKEMGLQLKNMGERGWVLYNWQTLDITTAQKAGTVAAEKTIANTAPKKDTVIPKNIPVDTPKTESKTSQTSIAETPKGEDKFSRMMAGVVNDSAFMYNAYVDKVPKKDTVKTEVVKKTGPVKIDSTAISAQRKNAADSLQKQTAAVKADGKKKPTATPKPTKPPVLKTDSAALALNEQKKNSSDSVQQKPTVVKKEISQKAPPQKTTQPAFVQKISEENLDTALRQMYIAYNKDGKTDTVDVVIGLEKTIIVKPATDTIKKIAEVIPQQKEPVKEAVKKDTTAAIINKEENKTVTVAAPHVADSIKKDSSVAKKPVPAAKALANTNCKVSATDYDVDKLRVKILAVESEDDKIAAARKYFKTKCFTTSQVKALSELFPSDEGRYRLFDTAYPFVTDTDNFHQLSALLTAPYYINRFNAMIMQ